VGCWLLQVAAIRAELSDCARSSDVTVSLDTQLQVIAALQEQVDAAAALMSMAAPKEQVVLLNEDVEGLGIQVEDLKISAAEAQVRSGGLHLAEVVEV